MKHVIAEIRFPEHGSNEGPCSCCCGWEGQASDFRTHRYSEGLDGGKLRGGEGPSAWNRVSYKRRLVML